jgi:hypothetical protein
MAGGGWLLRAAGDSGADMLMAHEVGGTWVWKPDSRKTGGRTDRQPGDGNGMFYKWNYWKENIYKRKYQKRD